VAEVVAWATQRVVIAALPGLRQQVGTALSEFRGAERRRESTSFLKHADEQTIVGLAAVLAALREPSVTPDASTAKWTSDRFRDWGVVASPRFLGRSAMAASLQRYRAEGAWGVSPHLIPHRSLHSLSGTISQALAIHGPNFGTGGGPGGDREALLSAFALLQGQQVPGVWVVCTRLDPEAGPDDSGQLPAECFLEGLALALTPAPPANLRGQRTGRNGELPRVADLPETPARRLLTLHLGGSGSSSARMAATASTGQAPCVWDLLNRSGATARELPLGGGLRCVVQW
jgi:hypothetical protein